MSGLFITCLFIEEVLGSVSDSTWCFEFPRLMEILFGLETLGRMYAIALPAFVGTNLDACNLDP